MILPQYGVMGVFDGVGGCSGSDRAAQVASTLVAKAYREKLQPKNLRTAPVEKAAKWIARHCAGHNRYDAAASQKVAGWLTQELNDISEVIRASKLGLTTATVAQIERTNDRGTWLHFGSTGDSRAFLWRGDKVYQLTTDDGSGRTIDRCLGADDPAIDRPTQTGSVQVGRGDVIILATDGFTGDFGTDRITSQEMERLLLPYGERRYKDEYFEVTAQDIAETLKNSRRKVDDCSVAVAVLS